MLRVGVLVSGGGTNLLAIIDAVESGKITNAAVVTVAASKAGVYALERAEKHGIPATVIARRDFASPEEYSDAICAHMKENNVDLIVLAGFLSILCGKILDEYDRKIINIHPSLIPSFCGGGFYGLKVHEAALARGVKLTGATVHYVNGITDGGEIIAQKAVEVKEGDTPEVLQRRVMEQAEWVLLPAVINEIANSAPGAAGE